MSKLLLLLAAASPACVTWYGFMKENAIAESEKVRTSSCAASVARLGQSLASSDVNISRTVRDVGALIAQLERARTQAGIGDEKLIRVAPSRVKPVTGTPYGEVIVQIELRGISLAQLFEFYSGWQQADGGKSLAARLVRLTAPRDNDADRAPERWNAELEVALLTLIDGKDKSSR